MSAGLLTVVVLALLDAIRTHRYHRKKLPESVKRRSAATNEAESSRVREAATVRYNAQPLVSVFDHFAFPKACLEI